MQIIQTSKQLKELYNFVFLSFDGSDIPLNVPGVVGLEIYANHQGIKSKGAGAFEALAGLSCVFSLPRLAVSEFRRVDDGAAVIWEPNYFLNLPAAGLVVNIRLELFFNCWHCLELKGVKLSKKNYTIRELIIELCACLAEVEKSAGPESSEPVALPVDELKEEKKPEPKKRGRKKKNVLPPSEVGENKSDNEEKKQGAPGVVEVKGIEYIVKPKGLGLYDVIKKDSGEKLRPSQYAYKGAVLLYECGD